MWFNELARWENGVHFLRLFIRVFKVFEFLNSNKYLSDVVILSSIIEFSSNSK